MTVRMKDIATDLNLSKMTISKVLRGQLDVSAQTKARVLQRAKELNYRPNISARSLRTGRTLNIGLIVPSFTDPFFTAIARKIVQQLRIANYSVFLSSAEYDPELEGREIEQQLSWQVDALILASIRSSEELQQATRNSHTPIIHLPSPAASVHSNAIVLDGEEIGHLAASHLTRVGCRKIAYVRGFHGASADLPLKGFQAALIEAGQRMRPDLNIGLGNFQGPDYERGAVAARALLQCKIRPDGIVCTTDLIALGAMDALSAAGLQIPKDVAVIGCGNAIDLCETRIPLTSVDLSCSELGDRASKLTLKLLSQQKPTKVRNIIVSPTLVVRASTAR